MSYLDSLRGKVYQAPEFRSKGRRMELEDAFLVREEGKAYVLFLTLNASLSGENRSYAYTLYSIQDEKTVEPDNPVFRTRSVERLAGSGIHQLYHYCGISLEIS